MDEAPVTISPLPSHVIAVLAHQRAVKAVKRQLRAKGLIGPGASLIAPSIKNRLMHVSLGDIRPRLIIRVGENIDYSARPRKYK